MKTKLEKLEKAIIDLALRNGELSEQLKESEDRAKMYREWWQQEQDLNKNLKNNTDGSNE